MEQETSGNTVPIDVTAATFLSPQSQTASIHGIEAVPSTKHSKPRSIPNVEEEEKVGIPITDNGQPRASSTIPKDQFFGFQKDQHGEPTMAFDPEHKESMNQMKIEESKSAHPMIPSQSIERSLSVHTEDMFRERDVTRSSELFESDSKDQNADLREDTVTTCVYCLLYITIILLIGAGIYYDKFSRFSPRSQDLADDPAYPECNLDRFIHEIEPTISKRQKEEWSLAYDAYEMEVDPRVLGNVMDQIRDENKELVLLYGSIERHVGTLRLFQAIEAGSGTVAPKIWIYDLTDLEYDSNGTVHERINCLFKRADQWTSEHPERRLLVVLDHISHYFRQHPVLKDRGVVWNKLSSIGQWKHKRQWTLFVVEADPTEMNVENDGKTHDYAKRIFHESDQSDRVQTICLQFTGSYFFGRLMRSLTTSNPDTVTMEYKDGAPSGDEWKRLMDKMRAFSLEDAFHLYHDEIRAKAHEMERDGFPIMFRFEEIEKLAVDHPTQFGDATIRGMERFAASFGQSIYIHLDAVDAADSDQTANAVKKTSDALGQTIGNGKSVRIQENQLETQPFERHVLKTKFIYGFMAIAVILLLILTVWSCHYFFETA